MSQIELPRLLAITDSDAFAEPGPRLEPLLRAARPGSVAIVVRDRQLPRAARRALAEELGERCRRTAQLLWIAGDAALTEAVGARGLHLSTDAPPAVQLPEGVRDLILTRAVHAGEQLADEELAVLSAVLISPVFEPRKGRGALGVEGFFALGAALRARAPHLGLYALGGVRPERVGELLAGGATGVAAIGAAHDPQPERLLEALGCLAEPCTRGPR